MLDKLCKKIVKYMNGKEHPSDYQLNFMEDLDLMAESVQSDPESVRAAIRYLKENGYLEYCYTKNGIALLFHLSHKGLHWKFFRRREVLNYIAEKWPDFIALVISLASLLISILAIAKGK